MLFLGIGDFEIINEWLADNLIELEDLGDADISLGPHLEEKPVTGFGWKPSSDDESLICM